MARLSPADVDRVAALAHLRLGDDLRSRLAADLEEILDYVDRLRTVPTDGVPVTSHLSEGAGDLRPDRPEPSLPRDEALANATDANARSGLFRVPRVIGA